MVIQSHYSPRISIADFHDWYYSSAIDNFIMNDFPFLITIGNE
ncbi:hypothetical protein Y11_09451 [Yersinia enterocolitica subsp. palearctica Y11]|uniref:Uncharacterized protein n=1 Tax=Yersinia enterocolitica subsp. palearctica serotype O:3 (strain DSM 13030 / CIP 106945 / Y11) TaxID=930944 RepID=A0A0H3NRL8_YERE1|nr:hypothetical protein Y11_09451 [Yersinia enterocolitica subsp. palearctica Y11]